MCSRDGAITPDPQPPQFLLQLGLRGSGDETHTQASATSLSRQCHTHGSFKYRDVESADTWKQMHSPVSCRLEGSDFSPWPSRLCSTHSACPLGCLILLDRTPSPLPALAALPPSRSCPPPGLCTGSSSTQKTVPLSSFRAQLRMPPLTLWLSRHPISVLAAFLSAIIHV